MKVNNTADIFNVILLEHFIIILSIKQETINYFVFSFCTNNIFCNITVKARYRSGKNILISGTETSLEKILQESIQKVSTVDRSRYVRNTAELRTDHQS